MRLFTVPDWTKGLFPGAIWDVEESDEKTLYLTFDDGPCPEVTDWVLNLLKDSDSKATFFCVGSNVEKHPELFDRLRADGHEVGSHTMDHLNGWKTDSLEYISDAKEAASLCETKLFRPPYGRLRPAQFRALKNHGFKVVFWSLLTYDFDAALSSEKRLDAIRSRVKDGAILVFHDSVKAFPQLKVDLPILLKEWIDQGYKLKAIPA